MSSPLSALLFGAALFIIIGAIGLIRGFKLKERAYKIYSIVPILLSIWLILLYYRQIILSMGFLLAAGIIALVNRSKPLEATSREVTTAHNEADLSKPLRISDIFTWGGWFKIIKKWGTRKALLLFILFNLCVVELVPIALLIFNIGNIFFVGFFTSILTTSAIIWSIPIFNQQIVRTIEIDNANCRSDSHKDTS